MGLKSMLVYASVAAMGAGVFYLATRDVRQGSRIMQQGAQQFRSNMKTMKHWAEEAEEKTVEKAKSLQAGLKEGEKDRKNDKE